MGKPFMLGERLCLDFVNTVEPRRPGSEPVMDLISRYEDLACWSRYAGILTKDEEVALLETVRERPGAGPAVVSWAIALREAIYRIVRAHIYREDAPGSDLGTLNLALAGAMARSRLVHGTGGFSWEVVGLDGEPDRMIWPIALSALELLTSKELDRVNICPEDAGCGWLFLDTTKNGSRRWCSMDICGSRAKSRRQYARIKALRA